MIGRRTRVSARMPKYLLTVSNNNEAHIWSRQTGKVMIVLKRHADTIFSAAFSSDGSRVVTASYDTTAIVWDAKTGEIITRLTGHEAPVLDAKFSPNGQYVLTGSGITRPNSGKSKLANRSENLMDIRTGLNRSRSVRRAICRYSLI